MYSGIRGAGLASSAGTVTALASTGANELLNVLSVEIGIGALIAGLLLVRIAALRDRPGERRVAARHRAR